MPKRRAQNRRQTLRTCAAILFTALFSSAVSAAERACKESFYTLDCFLPYDTKLLQSHEKQLDRIVDEIVDSHAGRGSYRPIDHVAVIGHSAYFRANDPADEKALERAQNAARYLQSEFSRRDVSGIEVVVDGMGTREPVTTNETRQGRNINRRVEIYVRSSEAFRQRLKRIRKYLRKEYSSSREVQVHNRTCDSDRHAESHCKTDATLGNGERLVAAICLPLDVRCLIGRR